MAHIRPSDQAESREIVKDIGKEEWDSAKSAATWDPPDGGVRAWLQVLGSFLIFFNIWSSEEIFTVNKRSLVLTLGVSDSFYRSSLLQTYSPSEIAWIGTTQVFCLNFVGVLTGPIFDMEHHDLLLYISSFTIIFGIMMLSLSTQHYQILLSQGLCLGIGS